MPKLIQNNEFISGSPIMDATPQPNSTHAVQSGGVYTAFNNLSTEVSAINSKLSQFEINDLKGIYKKYSNINLTINAYSEGNYLVTPDTINGYTFRSAIVIGTGNSQILYEGVGNGRLYFYNVGASAKTINTLEVILVYTKN